MFIWERGVVIVAILVGLLCYVMCVLARVLRMVFGEGQGKKFGKSDLWFMA